MNEIIISVIISMIGILLGVTAFSLGRMQGRHRERMFLLKTLTECDLPSSSKSTILDELERTWNR